MHPRPTPPGVGADGTSSRCPQDATTLWSRLVARGRDATRAMGELHVSPEARVVELGPLCRSLGLLDQLITRHEPVATDEPEEADRVAALCIAAYRANCGSHAVGWRGQTVVAGFVLSRPGPHGGSRQYTCVSLGVGTKFMAPSVARQDPSREPNPNPNPNPNWIGPQQGTRPRLPRRSPRATWAPALPSRPTCARGSVTWVGRAL